MEDKSEDISFDKPVEEGKTYKVEIEDLGSKGDGIARVDNFVVFVPDADVGETVEVEITSVGRRFAFGEIVERDVEGYEKEETEEVLDKEDEEEREKEEEEKDDPLEKVDIEEDSEEDLEEQLEEELDDSPQAERYDRERVEEEEL